jgi:hypothetical protein
MFGMKKKTGGGPKLVMIEWLDSQQSMGWTRDEPAAKPMKCRSVGWLVYDGKDMKTLASNITEEENPQRTLEMTIPVCSITKIKSL